MLRLYTTDNHILIKQHPAEGELEYQLKEADWIDASSPTEEERLLLESFLHTDLPEADEVTEIEASARYFSDHNGIHIHSLFLSQSEGRHTTATVAFILQPKRLITLRDTELADFRLLRLRIRRGWVEADSPQSVLMTLFDQKVENLADALEDLHHKLEDVSHLVLEDEDAELEDSIDRLAKLEDSNGKIRLCLMDTQRSVTFLQRHLRYHPESLDTAREIMRDIDTLMAHTTFLFDKINFLMDAAQGFINIEQNQIIKTLSIAAMVFLPPTMVASIYGMNFHFMPELDWALGYPWALTLMAIAGFAPYWYVKRKGWL